MNITEKELFKSCSRHKLNIDDNEWARFDAHHLTIAHQLLHLDNERRTGDAGDPTSGLNLTQVC